MDCEVSGKNGGPVSYHAAQKEILPPAQLLSVAGLRPEGTNGEGSKILQNTVQSISDLKKSKYCRTNPWGMTQAHHAKVAEDIERILLRSYRMDPTDYGVYNAYHLFLVIHNLRANPASELQAKKVAGISVAAAMNEEESPFPWLTAASALLDQFLLDQQKSREMGQDLPWSVIDDYGKRIAYCLERFRAIQEVALTEHRWERIGAERTASALDRLQFLERAAEQFGAMLARMESRRSCVRR